MPGDARLATPIASSSPKSSQDTQGSACAKLLPLQPTQSLLLIWESNTSRMSTSDQGQVLNYQQFGLWLLACVQELQRLRCPQALALSLLGKAMAWKSVPLSSFICCLRHSQHQKVAPCAMTRSWRCKTFGAVPQRRQKLWSPRNIVFIFFL